MTPHRYGFIDATRGYAILLVIAVHSSQYFDNLRPAIRTLADQGARGVQLFFVASALTLCLSWNARHDGAVRFYIRRFFRIAPMFYLALLFFVCWVGVGKSIYAPDGIGLRHILMTATFTHGLMPDTITSVVPGSWSIADEMMFYVVFPVLVMSLNRVSFFVTAVAVVIVTLLLAQVQQHAWHSVAVMTDPTWRAAWGTFVDLWFVHQLPCFLFGMLLAKWINAGGLVRWPRTLVVGALVAMIALAFYPQPPLLNRIGLPVRYGIVFALFVAGLSQWQPRVLVNPVIRWIGKVSYSAYLVHLALLSSVVIPHDNYLEAFVVLTALTVAISSVTYFCVEEPGNKLGRYFIRRLRDTPRKNVEDDPLPKIVPPTEAVALSRH
jgi:peptidoglycan/LPS O-acetylase OafA/YrhL